MPPCDGQDMALVGVSDMAGSEEGVKVESFDINRVRIVLGTLCTLQSFLLISKLGTQQGAVSFS